MQSPSSTLPIFRSPGQERILTRLLMDETDGWRSVTELAGAVALAASNVSRELDRLEAAGLVESERAGNIRRVRADRSSRFHAELRALVLKAFGAEALLGRHLSRVEGIRRAYIFGSWARRQRGETVAEPPRDIDILVVGDPDPDAVYHACVLAETELDIDVAPVIVDEAAWSEHPAPTVFLETIRRGSLIELDVIPKER